MLVAWSASAPIIVAASMGPVSFGNILSGSPLTPCTAPFCDGGGGLSCAGFSRCVDDPGDDCVPERGGTGCAGTCA